jgi:hypothetical protein
MFDEDGTHRGTKREEAPVTEGVEEPKAVHKWWKGRINRGIYSEFNKTASVSWRRCSSLFRRRLLTVPIGVVTFMLNCIAQCKQQRRVS